ncbi:hypothetical protein [Paenibacillus sp. NPDC058174]|uniref:hypothetical protein n=1 Tax=Paenibacillus sp. NPDC058174 TaxID=3346366 RepID=UPI0036DE2DEB
MNENQDLQEIKDRLTQIETKLEKKPSFLRNFLMGFGIVFIVMFLIGVIQFITKN